MASKIEDVYSDEDEQEFVPPTEEELKQMEERRKKSDEISAELGRRMLQGWGLMGTACPQDNCITPLMKEPKTGKLYCVNCNAYVLTEAEYEAAQAESKKNAPVAPSAATPTSTTPQTDTKSTPQVIAITQTPPTSLQSAPVSRDTSAPSSSSQSKNFSSRSDTNMGTLAPMRDFGYIPSTTRPSHATDETGGPSPNLRAYVSDVACNAILTLTARLEDLTSQCASNTMSPDQATVTFRLMAECANALATVQRMASESNRL